MISVLIFVFSAALLLFYIQVAVDRILERPFLEPLARPIVEANRLSFLDIRHALETGDASGDSSGVQVQLNRDFRALTSLLRHAGSRRRPLSGAERVAAIYFRVLSGLCAAGQLFGMQGHWLRLKMISVLEFFANVLGERTRRVRLCPAQTP